MPPLPLPLPLLLLPLLPLLLLLALLLLLLLRQWLRCSLGAYRYGIPVAWRAYLTHGGAAFGLSIDGAGGRISLCYDHYTFGVRPLALD